MNRAEKVEYAQLLEESIKRDKNTKGQRVYESFYGWQREFNAETKNNTACALIAANQVGKTRTGCAIGAIHLTGDYPDNWEGYIFDFPPLCWMLGFSGEKTRDLLQTKLFGRFLNGEFEGGYVPSDRILDHRAMSGTSGAMREVRVKHEKGISVCQFWSYSQGPHALMGDVVDWYEIDEEPKDQTIYPQVLTRTINGDRNRGGRGILTFTPENGKTELVIKFMDNPSAGQYLQTATWDQSPHISDETKEIILAQYPAYQRDMRSKGMPLMGSGLIYEIDENLLKVDPFEVPEYWFVINGMDFGWDHPQAHIQMVWDRDADIYYIINAWKASKKQPFEAWHIVKPWAKGVPTAWPADGLQTEKGSAKQQKEYYEEEGFNFLPEHAQWEDGGVGVWAGIMELNNLMSSGRLKIVSTLFEVFEELRQYHTKTNANGKIEIVKIRDDLVDAIRYAYMSRRFAIRICDINPDNTKFKPKVKSGRDSRMGY